MANDDSEYDTDGTHELSDIDVGGGKCFGTDAGWNVGNGTMGSKEVEKNVGGGDAMFGDGRRRDDWRGGVGIGTTEVRVDGIGRVARRVLVLCGKSEMYTGRNETGWPGSMGRTV